jgi:hypothetical protein
MQRAGMWLASIMALACGSTGCDSGDDELQDRSSAARAGDAGGESTAAGSSARVDAGAAAPTDDPAPFPDAMLPDAVLDSLDLITPVPGGQAFFTDIVELEPGADITYCTFLEGVTSELTYIHNTLGSQSQFGHHAILYYTTEPQEPGTRACAMHTETMRQVLGGTGGEGTGAYVPPPNVVSEVPAGAQFVINHHWIHYGTEPAEVQAMIVTEPAMTDQDLVIARSLAMVVTGFEIAPGESGEQSDECTFEEDVDMLSMLGHEHEWGTHVRAELTRAGGESEVLLDHDYDPDMVSHPLIVSYEVDAPLRIRTGDTLGMHCQWHNDSDSVLSWPSEMCVLFGWKIGGAGDTICFNGSWIAR